MKPLVVKLGGSLAEAGTIEHWLKLVAVARRPIVIVPGGGPFADAVRAFQDDTAIDDGTAHQMALLGMNQMGLAVASLAQRFKTAETLTEIRDVIRARRIPVWLPVKLARTDKTIPADWSVTSDGLAARLAERLGGEVVLVKSCRIRQGFSLEGLICAGIADPTFAAVVERAALVWHVVGPGEEEALARLVAARGQTPRRTSRRRRRPTPSTRLGPHARARN